MFRSFPFWRGCSVLDELRSAGVIEFPAHRRGYSTGGEIHHGWVAVSPLNLRRSSTNRRDKTMTHDHDPDLPMTIEGVKAATSGPPALERQYTPPTSPELSGCEELLPAPRVIQIRLPADC